VGYTRCQSCGRYLQDGGRYCSEACAQRFASCATCGDYFPLGSGYSERYCSADCAVQYRTVRSDGWIPAATFAEGTS